MKAVFAYTRVSTIKQGQQGSSLSEQKEAISRYAAKNDLSIKEWFEEQETAAKRGRPIFTNMLKRLERGQATGVIIHKIDRGARNLRDWADLAELVDRGIEIHCAHESLDLQSRGGRLAADIQAVIAADYIRNLRDEVIKGIYGRYRQGLYPHQAPIGYLNQGGGKPKIPDPIKAPLIKQAFELYATEAYNLKALNRKMASLGLVGLNGRALSDSTFALIFSNEFYIGIIVVGRTGERFQGIHRPLIEPELFERVQKVLQSRRAHTGLKYDFAFRRLIRCKTCGFFIVGERQKSWIYYRCHTTSCPTNSIREDALEEAIHSASARIALPIDLLPMVQAEFERLATASAPKREELIQRHQLALARLNEKLDRLTNAYVEGLIDKPSFVEKQKETLLQIASAKRELADIRDGTMPILEKTRKFFELQKTLNKAKTSRNMEEMVCALKLASSNCYLSAKKLSVKWKNGLQILENLQAVRCGGLSLRAPRTARMTSVRKTLKNQIEEICREIIRSE